MKPLHIGIGIVAIIIVGALLASIFMPQEPVPLEGVSVESAGLYAEYDPTLLARAEEGKVVLFFQASWCPSCRALDSDIRARLGDIPEEMTILRLDYDEETELRRLYEVTTQHTMVQVDANGALIKKWSGGNRLANIVEQVI